MKADRITVWGKAVGDMSLTELDEYVAYLRTLRSQMYGVNLSASEVNSYLMMAISEKNSRNAGRLASWAIGISAASMVISMIGILVSVSIST
ncbi:MULTISPECIES: hypothetical protein [Thalassospira]|nr:MULTISPECIES: hypothetical protein [Thalassospira]MCH2275620.1 hypothetical protein [Thalassospira sp.]